VRFVGVILYIKSCFVLGRNGMPVFFFKLQRYVYFKSWPSGRLFCLMALHIRWTVYRNRKTSVYIPACTTLSSTIYNFWNWKIFIR